MQNIFPLLNPFWVVYYTHNQKISCQYNIFLTGFQVGFALENSYYKLFMEFSNWTHAHQLCIERGAYLAELSTRTELDTVTEALHTVGTSYFYVSKMGQTALFKNTCL